MSTSSTTIGILVEPRYLPEQSSPADRLYTFAYTITVTNNGSVPAQLIARQWVIDDAAGQRQEVKGLGVIGQQPLIPPGESFRYTSGCRLHASTGTMHGSYFFVTEQGDRFDVPIPMFVLDASTDSSAGDIPAPRVLH